MEAAGVTGVLASDGTQQLGTAHRGTDPATSVVGPVRRSHDVLKLAHHGSVRPTAGVVNSSLTIEALALRSARIAVGANVGRE
ncbi:MAG TPA: GMC oxidoreductase [Actinomycetota bacterium]